MALVKALARAYRWRQMLLDGEVTSIEALARRVKLDRGHVGLTLDLAFLSPAITRAIIRGEQPPGLRLTHLLGSDIPLSWREQETMIGRAADAAGG
jgi:arginase family enzyme